MSKYEAKLASRLQGVAGCMSYNGGDVEATAKHLLLEASHVIDSHAVKIDLLSIRNARGKARLLTLRERLAIWLLGGRTEIRP